MFNCLRFFGSYGVKAPFVLRSARRKNTSPLKSGGCIVVYYSSFAFDAVVNIRFSII